MMGARAVCIPFICQRCGACAWRRMQGRDTGAVYVDGAFGILLVGMAQQDVEGAYSCNIGGTT